MKKYFFTFLIILIFFTSQSHVLAEADLLKVEENKIFFNGEEVILRGVAMGSPHYRYVFDGRSNISDYQAIKHDWQANTVRVSMHPGVWLNDREVGKKSLESEVKVARDLGLFVIIDWHAIGMPDGWHKEHPRGNTFYYSYSSNYELAKSFWRYAAVKFRDDQGVLFEIWNEPKNKDGDLSWDDIRGYMQGLYNIIRNQEASNVIIAPGVYWSYDLKDIKDDPLNGDNIAYAWHNYPGNVSQTSWDKAIDSLYNQYPIIVTEWGFGSDPGDLHYSEPSDFGEKIKNFIIEKELHFTAWCWHEEWYPAMFKNNWQDLTTFGSFTKNFLNNFEEISDVNEKINYFLDNGVDENTENLGRGERLAVVYSFQEAFGRFPQSELDYEDIIKIARGHWPTQRSLEAEEEARDDFWQVYKREPNMNNQYDDAAITVMAYGLRQKAENRNLDSEARALSFFNAIYGHMPSSTDDWNILQAITYSGATR